MKRFLCILFCTALLFTLSACADSNENKKEIASQVVITLPKDDTVNGYKIKNADSSTEDSMPNTIIGNDISVGNIQSEDTDTSYDYCANKNSKVFHKPSCISVSSMKDSNKYFADRDTLIGEGYSPCGKCNP